MNDCLIYLASPYSHPDRAVRQARFRIANRVAAELMTRGSLIFSPLSMSVPIAEEAGLPDDWSFWSVFDRALISRCQKMIVIDIEGLAESVGVRAEIAIANELGIPVEYYKP